MSFDVRTIAASEIGAWTNQKGIGFHKPVADGYADYLLGVIDLDRTWGAFDGAKAVGTLRSFPTPLTVPGCLQVKAAALTNVTVAPTHRRKGLLTAMITADLRASKERGEAVGILIASEWPIYGRYGYGPAVQGATYKVDSAPLRFLHPASGSVELIDRLSLRHEGPKLYDQFRLGQPGSIERNDHWWDRKMHQVEAPGDEPAKWSSALYRSASGEPEGYVIYSPKPDWDGMRPQGTMSVEELLAVTEAAYRALWEFCASVDLLTTIEAPDRAVDEHLPLLIADGRLVKQTARYDFVWVRILDVAAALEGRSYSSGGRVVIEVVDELGLAGGRFAVEGGPEGASCSRTSDPADLTMPVATLGACYLGGEAFVRLAAAGRLEEHKPGAVVAADRMFLASRQPWCTTWF